MTPEETKAIELQAETQIFIGLIKALSEQSQYLTGEFKQNLKLEFKNWQSRGFDIVSQLEAKNKGKEDHMDYLTDCYHNINLEIRKNLRLKLSEAYLKDIESVCQD